MTTVKQILNDSVRLSLGGGNNQTFIAEVDDSKVLLKKYFSDHRQRFSREMGFYEYLLWAGVDSVPELILSDADLKIAVFQYIDGQKCKNPTRENIEHCVQFISEINSKLKGYTTLFTKAAEAAFSLQQHINIVEERINKLENKAMCGEILISRLREKFNLFDQHIDDSVLPPKLRCLSPSDFGFHNILYKESKPYFIDFEYGGLDDPAKLICDFLCQVQIPIKEEDYAFFIGELIKVFPEDSSLEKRVQILMPYYRIKWCCIMLNFTFPAGRKVKEFSGQDLTLKLKEAEHYFEKYLE